MLRSRWFTYDRVVGTNNDIRDHACLMAILRMRSNCISNDRNFRIGSSIETTFVYMYIHIHVGHTTLKRNMVQNNIAYMHIYGTLYILVHVHMYVQ